MKSTKFSKYGDYCFWILLLVMSIGCSSTKVVSHQTPGTDLNLFTTYTIASNENFSASDLQKKDQMENALIAEMEALNYNYMADGEMKVHYQQILGAATNVRRNRDGYAGYGRYYRFNSVNIDRFNEGILLVEIKQANNQRILWQGSIDLKINRHTKKPLDIAEIVHLIFEQFPGNQETPDPIN